MTNYWLRVGGFHRIDLFAHIFIYTLFVSACRLSVENRMLHLLRFACRAWLGPLGFSHQLGVSKEKPLLVLIFSPTLVKTSEEDGRSRDDEANLHKLLHLGLE